MSSEQTSYSAVLGVVLSALRKKAGLEQGRMAEKMGLSQASYSRLESGKSTFSVNQMFQAAGALGVSREELFQRFNSTIAYLESSDVIVSAQPRVNNAQAKNENPDVGHFIAGAALATFVIGLISRN